MLKINAKDTEWLFGADDHATVYEQDLATRLGRPHIVEEVRDGEDLLVECADGVNRTLKYQGEDVQDGETTAWNFSDEDYYLKVEKG
jgi:hypothetical protein